MSVATSLPGIISQRWAAAVAAPSLRQWYSIAIWLEDFARITGAHPATEHMADELRTLAAEARQHVRALLPEIEAAA